MPPSTRHEWSRRRFLTGSAVAAIGVLSACDSDDNRSLPTDQGSTPSAAQGAGSPASLEPMGLPGVRLPGEAAPMALTIQGSRILSVNERLSSGVRTLDTEGGVVVPGFTDCHVHMQFADPAAVLAGGVTTVRDLGGPEDAAQAMRGQSDLRILISGRILTPVGGYPSQTWGADGTAREVSGVEDAVQAVDEQIAAGAVVVKVALEPGGGAPVFELDTLTAIVERARTLGVRTTVHVGSSAMLDLAIDAGVAELAHLPLYDVGPADMTRAAEAGMVLVPTLEIRGTDEAAGRALAAFRDAGGAVLYGSDLGNGGTSPGIESTEVRLMQEARMTPAEVLRSATSDPAAYLGLDNGVLEAGKVADIVVLGADPFDDPAAYDDVRLVVANGVVVG